MGILHERNLLMQHSCIMMDTTDGRNPAPVDRQFIPLLRSFIDSRWRRISSMNSMQWSLHLKNSSGTVYYPCRYLKLLTVVCVCNYKLRT